MAFLLRRTLLGKCIPFLRYPRFISNHSQLTHALTFELDNGAPLFSSKGGIVCAGFDPFWAIRRGFAKGRKSKDESSSATIQVVPDIGPTVKSNTLSLMEAAIAALSRELSKIRTGRASTGMLDHIIVDAHGVKLPLNRVSVVSAVDAHTLSVTPHDPNCCLWQIFWFQHSIFCLRNATSHRHFFRWLLSLTKNLKSTALFQDSLLCEVFKLSYVLMESECVNAYSKKQRRKGAAWIKNYFRRAKQPMLPFYLVGCIEMYYM